MRNEGGRICAKGIQECNAWETALPTAKYILNKERALAHLPKNATQLVFRLLPS